MKDSIGIACSVLCIGHCVLTPVLALSGGLGVLGSVLEFEGLHQGLLALVVVIALVTFPAGWREHRQILFPLLAVVGLTLLAAALALDEAYETPLTVAGGSMMAVAHFLNQAHRSQSEKRKATDRGSTYAR